MTNYNTLSHNLKRGICKFSEKISKELSRPDFKFVFQMLYGILNCQNSYLSSIARALEENISLKKTIDRLSYNLANFKNCEMLFSNYLKAIKGQFNNSTILIIDGSDITKPCSKKMESLCRVRDGSTGGYGNGYHTLGVTALTPEKKMPIPVYTRVYSSTEASFISEDYEVLKCFKFLSQSFQKSNIRALDRGYDNNLYFEYLVKKSEKFIARAKKNRDVIYKGKRINILDLASKFKGKYRLDFKKQNGLKVECKICIIPISLPCMPEKELNLVVVYGFGKIPMMLLSNLKSEDKRLAVAITKVYLMRWRIEEYYKFKKQQFNFEDMRVRSLQSIRNLDLLISIAIGYLGFMSEKQEERAIVMEIIYISKRIYGTPKFVYYAIADGLKAIFKKSKEGIGSFLKIPPKSMQICMFQRSDIIWF